MKFAFVFVTLILAIDPRRSEAASPMPSLVAASTRRSQASVESLSSVDLLPQEAAPAVVRGGADTGGLMDRLVVGFYFALWYALNVYYNSTFAQATL